MVQSIEDYLLQNISNRIKLQSYILSFLFFFFVFIVGEQYMKTPVKVSMKVQRIAGVLSRVSIWNVNDLQVYFCGIGSSLISFSQGGGRGGEGWNISNRKYHIFVHFLRKLIPPPFSVQEKYHVFGKKIPPFQIVQERSCPGAILFEKTIFSEHLK